MKILIKGFYGAFTMFVSFAILVYVSDLLADGALKVKLKVKVNVISFNFFF